MWAKLGQWAAQFVLIPLIKDLGLAIYNWIAKKLRRNKKEKENQEKSDAYASSTSPDASGDNFADLP